MKDLIGTLRVIIALSFYSKRSDSAFCLIQSNQIRYGQDIIGKLQKIPVSLLLIKAGPFLLQVPQIGILSGRRKRLSPGQVFSENLPVSARLFRENPCRLQQKLQVIIFTAETNIVDTAKSIQNPHSAFGKIRRGGGGHPDRQLGHSADACAQGKLCPQVLVHDRRLSALHKIPTHQGKDLRILSKPLSKLPDLILMA